MFFQKVFNNKIGLLALLGVGFILNWMETQMEGTIKGDAQLDQGYVIGRAFQSMEGGLDFSHFESLASWVIYGFSFSYFFLFPLRLALPVALPFTLRSTLLPFAFSFSLPRSVPCRPRLFFLAGRACGQVSSSSRGPTYTRALPTVRCSPILYSFPARLPAPSPMLRPTPPPLLS